METPLRYACVLIDEIFKLTIANKEHEDLLRMIVELLIPGKKIRKLTFNDKENHGLALSDKNVTINYAERKGREKGRAEGRAETARANAKSLRDLGVDVSILAKGTGLSEEEIRAL